MLLLVSLLMEDQKCSPISLAQVYGCFYYDTQYVEYDVSYGYYQNGIITYEYTYHLKTEKILADLKMAGTLVVVGGICYFMPAAAPETVIALGFV